MNQILQSLENHLNVWIGIIFGFGSLATIIYKKYYSPTVEFFKDMKIAIRVAKEQLSPNGGSSLLDSQKRIEKKQEHIEYVVLMQVDRNRLLSDVLGVIETEADDKGNLVYASRGYLQLVGRTIQEVLGNGWVTCVDPKDRETVFEEWQSCVSQKREFSMDVTLVSSLGESIKVHGKSKVVKNSTGDVIGHICIITKI